MNLFIDPLRIIYLIGERKLQTTKMTKEKTQLRSHMKHETPNLDSNPISLLRL